MSLEVLGNIANAAGNAAETATESLAASTETLAASAGAAVEGAGASVAGAEEAVSATKKQTPPTQEKSEPKQGQEQGQEQGAGEEKGKGFLGRLIDLFTGNGAEHGAGRGGGGGGGGGVGGFTPEQIQQGLALAERFVSAVEKGVAKEEKTPEQAMQDAKEAATGIKEQMENKGITGGVEATGPATQAVATTKMPAVSQGAEIG